jgi:hypothetical protein
MALDPNLQQAVQREIDCYGSLDAAVAGLWNDSCEARSDAPIHSILNAALKLQSERKADAKREAA